MSRLRRVLRGVFISLFTILIMLGVGEFYFRYVYFASDGFEFTLTHQRWVQTCWQPLNHVQYPDQTIPFRDHAVTAADVAGKVKVMIVGDSVVAGYGICDPKDRFADRLQAMLGPAYAVLNVGKGAWNSSEQWYGAVNYPIKPDIIIWSQLLNDIDGAIAAVHGDLPILAKRPVASNPVADFLTKNSYLYDYVYWQVIFRHVFQHNFADIATFEYDAYFDPKIWAVQEGYLQAQVDWAREMNAPLIVIVWPQFTEMSRTEPQSRQIERFFAERGAIVVSGIDLFGNDLPESLIVNRSDTHPNERAHRMASEALFMTLQKVLATRPTASLVVSP
jgi:hypothetical protein